jgi:hypothetical protein
LLKTRCGAENIKYEDKQGLWSWYITSLEHEENGAWKKGESVIVRMSSYPAGGSGGSDTLPIKGPGHWRIRAKQLITQKHNNEVTVSEPTDWTAFWIGEPQFEVASMDFSKLEKIEFDQQEYEQMDRVWESGKFKTITFRPLPQVGKDPQSRPILGEEAAKIKPAATTSRQPSDAATLKPQSGRQPGVKRTVIPPPRTSMARAEPKTSRIKPPKLELEDSKHVKTLKLTAGKSSEAIFPVFNSGGSASEATTYSVNCRKLSNAGSKCPDFNERGSLAVISALGRRDVVVKLTSVVAGEYELELSLANGAAKAVKLKVAEAESRRAPGASRKSPEAQPDPRAR